MAKIRSTFREQRMDTLIALLEYMEATTYLENLLLHEHNSGTSPRGDMIMKEAIQMIRRLWILLHEMGCTYEILDQMNKEGRIDPDADMWLRDKAPRIIGRA